jgi:hypothetical protein
MLRVGVLCGSTERTGLIGFQLIAVLFQGGDELGLFVDGLFIGEDALFFFERGLCAFGSFVRRD